MKSVVLSCAAVAASLICFACSGSSGPSFSGDGGSGSDAASDSGNPATDGASGPDGSGPGSDGGATMDGGGPGVEAGKDSASPPPTPSTGITITVEPDGSGDAAALLAAINSAETAVHVEMYLLTNSKYIDALIDLAKAGKDVKVLLNETFPTGTSSSNTNSSSYSQLMSEGVSVEWAPSTFTYTHEKAVIIDPAGGSQSQVWVMTMNLDTDAPKYNREFLAQDTDSADITEAESIFEADWVSTSITASGGLVVAPVPPNNAVSVLVDLINSATTSIYVEAEEFDDSGTDTEEKVFNALKAKASMVYMVLEDSTEASQSSAVSALQAAGGHVVGYPCSETGLDIHAKAIVVDGARAYVGSENFSGGSLGYNRELGVYFDEASAVSPVYTTIMGDYAKGSTYSSTCSF
jgi:cardiolipin synthase